MKPNVIICAARMVTNSFPQDLFPTRHRNEANLFRHNFKQFLLIVLQRSLHTSSQDPETPANCEILSPNSGQEFLQRLFTASSTHFFAEMSREKNTKIGKSRPEIGDFFRSIAPCDFFPGKIKNE